MVKKRNVSNNNIGMVCKDRILNRPPYEYIITNSTYIKCIYYLGGSGACLAMQVRLISEPARTNSSGPDRISAFETAIEMLILISADLLSSGKRERNTNEKHML